MSMWENAKLLQFLNSINLWVEGKCIFYIISDTRMKYNSKATDLRMKSSLINSKKALFDNRVKIRQRLISYFCHSQEPFYMLGFLRGP